MTNELSDRDWGGLRSIINEARQLEEEERRNPSPACPRCGTILDVNSRGQRNCPMGHFRDEGVPNAQP